MTLKQIKRLERLVEASKEAKETGNRDNFYKLLDETIKKEWEETQMECRDTRDVFFTHYYNGIKQYCSRPNPYKIPLAAQLDQIRKSLQKMPT